MKMKIGNISIWNIATRIPEIYGTLIALGLIVYFFIMYMVGLVYITELRLFNVFIMIAGVYFALRQYRRTHRGHIDYFHAFTTGMATAAIGAATFALFLFVYLLIDKNLMQIIAENAPLGFYLDPYLASFSILIEGTFSGLFVTFLLSNFLATRNPVPRVKGKSEVIQ
jgi:hypothetical protein